MMVAAVAGCQHPAACRDEHVRLTTLPRDLGPTSRTRESMILDSPGLASNLNPGDLVGAAEASRILELSHASSVTTYLRRYPDFPKPVVDVSSSHARLWNREDIERWQRERGKPHARR